MPLHHPSPALRHAAGPPVSPGPPARRGRRPGRPAAPRRRFSLPVAGGLRYRLLVAWLATVVVVAGGVLWLQRAARPRPGPPQARRPGVPAALGARR